MVDFSFFKKNFTNEKGGKVFRKLFKDDHFENKKVSFV